MKLPTSLTTVTPFSKFIALILFITLPFVSFLFGMSYQQKINSAVQVSNPTLSIKPNLTTTQQPISTMSAQPTVETANWKTYNVSVSNFSFKYPSDWQFVNENPDSAYTPLVLYPPTVDIKSIQMGGAPATGIYIDREYHVAFARSPKSNVSEPQPGAPNITNWREVNYSGVKGHYYETYQCAEVSDCFNYIYVDFPLNNGSDTLRISIYNNSDPKYQVLIPTFNQILSTFKFTN